MGVGVLIWSWLTFSLPIQHQNISHTHEIQKAQKQHRTGIASFYHEMFEGRKTANGEIFDNNKFTCASNYYKLGTYLKVTNLSNKKIVYVKVNDRMGHPGRTIDLAKIAAKELNFVKKGLARVNIEKVSSDVAIHKIMAQNTKWNNKQEQVEIKQYASNDL